MKINCYCGEWFELPYRSRHQVMPDFDSFCSTACIGKMLIKEGTSDRGEMWKNPKISYSQMDQPTEYYNEKLQMWFRSKGESDTADYFERSGKRWEYEPYMIKLGPRKTYTPDFWIPDFSFFVEVKWDKVGGTKGKMRKASKLGFDFLLMPEYVIRRLDKHGRSKHQ